MVVNFFLNVTCITIELTWKWDFNKKQISQKRIRQNFWYRNFQTTGKVLTVYNLRNKKMTPQLFSFLVFVKSTPFLYLEGRSQKKLRLLFEQICYDFYALEGYLANILVLKNDSISYFRFNNQYGPSIQKH